MCIDSAEPSAALSLDAFSYEALQTADWMEFERFTIDVLKRYYEPFGLSVRRTMKRATADLGADGAHDGEATIILGTGPPVGSRQFRDVVPSHPELGVLVTLWIEVKKRSRDNVDHHDLGGTLFLSSVEHVTKLVFVCNRSFTQQFREKLARYAVRNGTQFALIDGKSLIRLAGEITNTPRGTGGTDVHGDQQQAHVAADLHFRPDHLFRYADIPSATMNRTVGEPLFLEADCKIGALPVPYAGLRVELRYLGADPLTITPRSGAEQQAVGAGDRFRALFAVFPDRPCKLSLDLFEVLIFNENDQGVECSVSRGSEECTISGTILPRWIPPSRKRAHEELRGALQDWLSHGGTRAVDVLAIGGTGKTHLVRTVRSLWLTRSVREIFVDGSQEQTVNSAVLAILAQLFPIPVDEVTSHLAEIMTEWLVRSGMSKEGATGLAQYVSTRAEAPDLPFTHAQLAQFLAQILAERSADCPTVLVFEDLHKCFPTVVAMLHSLRQSLARFSRGRVFTLSTSREDSVWDDDAMRRDWRSSIIRMRTGPNAVHIRLTGFSNDEAIALVRSSIPTIETYHAQGIIEQVGTTPLGIREALALLVERGAIEADDDTGGWCLTDPEQMIRALDGQELRDATHYRLLGLKERYPEWLSDFLDSAACIGVSFDLEICAKNAGGPERRAMEVALAECRLLEVLRCSLLSPSQIQFDHDLVRVVLLRDMGAFRQRRLAQSLFLALTEREGSPLPSSLAYQAGLADACFACALKQAEMAGKAGRHMEAVQSLGLALAVTDQNVAATVFAVQKGRYRPSFDDAIAVAEPCIRPMVDRASRERGTCELLLKYIEHLVAVGSGGSPSANRAVTEAGMLAERLGDKVSRAILVMYHGRQEFNSDHIAESVQLHEAAEEMFAALPQTGRVCSCRSANLVRLAIGHRQQGRLEVSRSTLLRAVRFRRRAEWALIVQVRANVGATFFYVDWRQTRLHWNRALCRAKQRGLVDRYVHALIDIGHLDLLEDNTDAAAEMLETALALSRDRGLENSELRCLLNLGCLSLVCGNVAQGLELLRDADRISFRHENGRRQWRIRANMATAYFIAGDIERSIVTDRMVIRSVSLAEQEQMRISVADPCSGARLVLAFGNLALRAETSPPHRKLLLGLPPAARRAAATLADKVMADRLQELPGLRGRHCKIVCGQKVFLITE